MRAELTIPGGRWPIAWALVALSFIPVAAGMHRLGNLAAGHANSLEDGRFFAAPAPVVMHIIAVSVFAILGAFQFAPALRNPSSCWHRTAGWLVLPCGLVASLTGLWMTQFYPQIATDSALLYSIRLVVGVAMTSFLILAVVFLRKRAFQAHGASMMRAYALGMGAGTQVLTHPDGGRLAHQHWHRRSDHSPPSASPNRALGTGLKPWFQQLGERQGRGPRTSNGGVRGR